MDGSNLDIFFSARSYHTRAIQSCVCQLQDLRYNDHTLASPFIIIIICTSNLYSMHAPVSRQPYVRWCVLNRVGQIYTQLIIIILLVNSKGRAVQADGSGGATTGPLFDAMVSATFACIVLYTLNCIQPSLGLLFYLQMVQSTEFNTQVNPNSVPTPMYTGHMQPGHSNFCRSTSEIESHYFASPFMLLQLGVQW